jgi:hypothetical protein
VLKLITVKDMNRRYVMSKQSIVVRRPETHKKGPAVIVVFPLGEPVPRGIIIGTGSIISIEDIEDEG